MKNTIFYILENRHIENSEIIKKEIKDIKSKGFSDVLLQIRDTAFQLDHPSVIKTVAIISNECHKKDIKLNLCFITTNARPWWYSFFQKYPYEGEIIIYNGEGEIKNGYFNIPVVLKNVPKGAFVPELTGFIYFFSVDTKELIKNSSVTYSIELKNLTGVGKDNEWKQGETFIDIKGKISGKKKGKICVYAGIKCGHPEYNSESFKKFLKNLIQKYSNIPVDGVAWDEPGPPGSPYFYKLGDGIKKRFFEKWGYDITDKLIHLDYDTEISHSVRFHYYSTLRSILFDAQKFFVETAKKIWGSNISSGIHQTWMAGGSNLYDLRAGCIDYFYLSKVLSGGFTDAVFGAEKIMVYSLCLARSIGKMGNRPSWSNSWNFNPAEKQIERFTNLMAVNKIYWIAHSYGHGLAGHGPGYPYNFTWKNIGKNVKKLKKFQKFLSGYRSISNVAVYHSWESIACFNSSFIEHHNQFLVDISWQLTEKNILFDFVSTEQIEECIFENKLFKIGDNFYEILVIPWANLLTPGVYKILKEAVKKNMKVVISSFLPEYLTDGWKIKEKVIPGKMGFLSGKNVLEEYIKQFNNFPSDYFHAEKRKFTYGKTLRKGNFTFVPSFDVSKTVKSIEKLGHSSKIKISKKKGHPVLTLWEKRKERIVCLTDFYGDKFSCEVKGNNFKIKIKEKKCTGIKINKDGKILKIIEG